MARGRGLASGRGEDRPHRVVEHRHVRGVEGICAPCVPEEGGCLFDGRCLGECHRGHAAIDGAGLGDGGDRRVEDGDRRFGGRLDRAGRTAAGAQRADVVSSVAPRTAVAHRLGADEATADIGIEGGKRDGQLGGGLAGGQEAGDETVFILIKVIKIDQ